MGASVCKRIANDSVVGI